MRCSDCGEVIKPVVAMDIDGTLGDYHGHFTEFAETYTGRHVDREYDSSEPMRDWAARELSLTHQEFREIKLAYRQGGMKRSMPAYADATDVCQIIRKSGAELWLTTTRPYLRLDNIDPDTRAWLSRNGIAFDGLLYDEFKYSRLAERIDPGRVVAVVDDLYEMIDAAAETFGADVPIHRKNPYNLHYGHLSLGGMRKIQEVVLFRIKRWEKKHGNL